MQEQYRGQAEARQKQEAMLQQLRKGAQLFLTRTAQDRLDTLRISHPEKAAKTEAIIVRLAQNRQITREKPLDDEMLLEMLRKMEPKRETKIEFR